MSKPLRQAGIPLLLAFLFLAAASGQAATADRSGPAGAGGGETVGVDDLVSEIADTFDKLNPLSKNGAPEKKDVKQPEEIKAKRLDPAQTGKGQSQPAPAAPYKIYPSPVIRQEAASSFDPYESAREQASLSSSSTSFNGWGKEQAATMDLAKPPPLPAATQAELAREKEGAQAPLPVAGAEGARGRNVPPISALPKQFFPVIPFGALPDTAPQLLPVASNAPLEADHAAVRRAIIVIHDMQRNAAEGVATLMTLSGASPEDTLILAPQFPLALDILRFAAFLPDEGKFVARWPIDRGWQTGGNSILSASRQGVSSFTSVDLLLMYLADRRRFPSLERVILVGHGMGGDFVQRYAVAGQAPDILAKEGIESRFLVANPSSYLYFTVLRPAPDSPAFLTPDAKACPGVNSYPYGLFAPNDYARRVGMSEMRLRYPERKVVYLVGNKIIGDPYLDQNCAAQAQGRDRLSRGQNYARHLTQSFGDEVGRNQTFVFVPQAGYDPVSLYGSYCGMETLFGRGDCGK